MQQQPTTTAQLQLLPRVPIRPLQRDLESLPFHSAHQACHQQQDKLEVLKHSLLAARQGSLKLHLRLLRTKMTTMLPRKEIRRSAQAHEAALRRFVSPCKQLYAAASGLSGIQRHNSSHGRYRLCRL